MTFVLTTLFCFLIGFLFIIDIAFWITTYYPLSYQLYMDYKIKKTIDNYLLSFCNGYKYLEIKQLNNLSFSSDKGYSRVTIVIENNLATNNVSSAWDRTTKYTTCILNISLSGKILNMKEFELDLKRFDVFSKVSDKDFKSRLLIEQRNEKLKKLV